jgi:DNA-binding MarR family transcriptional regulator
MSQSRLADRLEIRPQSLSEMLAKIEGEGLIFRHPSEEDKRQTIVELTDAGKTRVAQFRVMHRQHAEEFLNPLSEEEKLALAGILKKLIETRIEEEKKQGGR